MAGQRLPGTGPVGQPLPSSDPVLPEDLISPALAQKIKALMSTEQMKKLASQETQAKFEQVVEGMITGLVTQSLEKMARTPKGLTQITQLADRIAAGGPATLGVPPVAATRASSESTTAPPPEAVPQRAPSTGPSPTYQSLSSAFHEGRQVTMGSIGRRAASAMQGYLSQATPNWEEKVDGSLVRYTGQTGSDGQPVIAEEVKPTDAHYGRTLRRVRMTQSAIAGLGSASEGGSLLTGRLGMIAGKAAGVAGIALTAAQQVGSRLEDQRVKAATYRQAFGNEGTGMFAARDRMAEFRAGLSGFGTIGGERAREDFRAASALGLRGDQRGAATGFSRDMFMKYGMGSGDAFAIVRQALEEGNISLNDYAESIRRVTKVAVDSGKSAAEAIQQLTSAQHALASQGISGGAGLSIAQSATVATSQMDRETASAFGGAAGLATSSLSQRATLMAAAQTGQDPAGLLYASQFGGEAAVAQSHTTAKVNANMLVTTIANYYGIPAERIRTESKGIHNSERQADINVEWAGGNASLAEYGVQQMMGLLPMMGYQPKDAADALRMFFSLASGEATPGGGAGISRSDKVTGHKDSHGNMVSYQRVDPNSVGSAGVSQHNQSAFVAGGGQMGHAAAQYLNMVDKTGQGSAAIEGLLSRKAGEELKAFSGHSLDDTKFVVRDSSGKNKTVSWSTIMGNADYRSQLADNTALIQGKGNEQIRVGDLSKVDTSGKGGKGTQKVEISFTGAAERLLKISGPTDYERAGMPSNSGSSYNPDTSPSYSGQ